MNESVDRVCVRCGVAAETAHLEQCHICNRYFCSDCAHRAGYGRRFCSPECGRAYYFTGEPDDDQDVESDE